MLVKRLVCIEDLGNIDVLFTDKTGTLTEGSLDFMRSAGAGRQAADDEPLLLGLLCNEAVVEDGRASAGTRSTSRCGTHRPRRDSRLRWPGTGGWRRCPSTTSGAWSRCWSDDDQRHRMIITKGAPEGAAGAVRRRPRSGPRRRWTREFAAGNRVVAVATRDGAEAGPRSRRPTSTA